MFFFLERDLVSELGGGGINQGSGIGVGGYTPLAGKILKIPPPPEDLEKIYLPLGGAKRRRHFLAKFWKLTLI